MSTHTAAIRSSDDPGYEDLTSDQWVLEDRGKYIATLDLPVEPQNMIEVERAVTKVLGRSGVAVATGVTGDTSHRNVYVKSPEWELR
jgi:hypothetical protein